MKNTEKRHCEVIWAEEKYFVLSKSQSIYQSIREYLKRDDVTREGLRAMIDKAGDLEENRKEVVNALHHIWGYFKKTATTEEKDHFFALLEEYVGERAEQDIPLAYLSELLIKYPDSYLENSSILKGREGKQSRISGIKKA